MGLFDRFWLPYKTYYAFKAFRALLVTPQRLACSGGNENKGPVIGAGIVRDGHSASILFSHFAGSAKKFRIQLKNLPWQSSPQVEFFAVDTNNDFESISHYRLPAGVTIIEMDCLPPSLRLLRLLP
jgi:hypothetical protein